VAITQTAGGTGQNPERQRRAEAPAEDGRGAFVKFGGLKFLDAAHEKDMLALLRFVENPRDRVAGFRVMHLLPGIGPASAQRILDHMAEATDPLGALCTLPSPPRTGDDWTTFVETIGNLRYSEWPSDLERARLWFEPHLDRIHWFDDVATEAQRITFIGSLDG
jgi:superfamily I DNA/RNA helicase